MMSGKNSSASPAPAAQGTGSVSTAGARSSSSAPTPPSPASASTSSPPAPRRGKLLRRSNSDRLRMHAPSSIQVDAPAATVAASASEWKLAIPLLSPLDYLDFTSPWLPLADDPHAATAPAEDKQGGQETRGSAAAADRVLLRPTKPWQHPAAPFYYDPVPAAANAAQFLLSQTQGA